MILHSVLNVFHSEHEQNPILAFIGYAILGAITAWLSLLVVPSYLISNPDLKFLNVFLTPVLIGALFSWRGRRRQGRGYELIRLDYFWYAYAFAFTMAGVRYTFAV